MSIDGRKEKIKFDPITILWFNTGVMRHDKKQHPVIIVFRVFHWPTDKAAHLVHSVIPVHSRFAFLGNKRFLRCMFGIGLIYVIGLCEHPSFVSRLFWDTALEPVKAVGTAPLADTLLQLFKDAEKDV